jgi:predicted ABC-type transport system involved in lysophospholipase L1 biosynthesis ATPase subunit
MSTHLSAKHLHRSFEIGKRKIEVLRGVSLNVEHGEAVFLCGASGAGKSTLLYTLAGLERPEEGTVEFEGTNIYGQPESALSRLRNRAFGFVFQAYHLLPELTAIENVMLPAMIGGASKRGKAESALGRVGLGERLHHLPAELSGGEQQRVAIARALSGGPQLLLADEPTGNLDQKTGESVFSMIRELHAERGLTSILVTHNEKLAAQCDEIWEMEAGRLQNPNCSQ